MNRPHVGVSWGNTVLLSPRTTFDLRLGYARGKEDNAPWSGGFDLATLGFPSQFLSQVQQQAFLEQTLSELDDARFEARLKALFDAWANADARALEDELQYEKTQDSVFATILLPRLIDERNRAMVDRIADIARSGTKSFVAVGALHLVGKEGIVELLRRRGFAVRQL